ncbi:hypothetical protein MHTCC0001_01800 [Flavobacteriaceae bacterium MHTCC 0001]
MEDQNYIQFEAYLSKELSEKETITFEERLNTEPEFQQAFETYKALSSFLEHKFENEEVLNAFRDNVGKISDSYFDESQKMKEAKSTAKTFTLMKYLVAASVAILFGIFTFNQFSTPTYNDYANHGTVSFTVRGDNVALLKSAEDAFNTKNYAEAEVALQSLITMDETNSELKLYRAITNIELNNFSVSDSILEALSQGKSVYKYKATWYLALSKLKQENHEASLQILKTIPEDADNFEQAQKLIGKLD